MYGNNTLDLEKHTNFVKSVISNDDFYSKIQSGEISLDQALYPGKQLADFDPESLRIEVLKSGFSSFDDAFVLKKNRGELVIIGGRPSQGKSAMLFQMAYNIAEHSKVHVFSLEMDHSSVATRQVAAMGNIPINSIQSGFDIETVLEIQQKLRALNFHIDDRSGLNVDEICYAARQEYKRSPTSAIFIDYVQLITSSDKGHSRANEIEVIVTKLKTLAKDLSVPVVIAAQLNRNSDSREDKRPILSDLKESGSLEQTGDVIILIYRHKDAPTEATVSIAKNRNGATMDLVMDFSGRQTKFLDRGLGI